MPSGASRLPNVKDNATVIINICTVCLCFLLIRLFSVHTLTLHNTLPVPDIQTLNMPSSLPKKKKKQNIQDPLALL